MGYVKGLVSVVIPTYKRSDMLRRAIDSVLDQTYKNVECIVVNDNTPGDEYSQILYKLAEEYKNNKRFHFLEQNVHKNGAAARNFGIKTAMGEYIAFLDDDDYWDKNKLEIQVPVLESLSDDWGAVSCLMRYFRNGVVTGASVPYKDGSVHYQVLSRSIGLGTGSLVIRRKALDETGYFDENLRRFQDPQLFSFLTEKYKVKLLKKYLHNRDVSDAQNRPTIDTINSYQEAYFESVKSQLDKLPQRKVNALKVIFCFDKAPIYWRGHQRIQAFIFFLRIFSCYDTVIMAAKRIIGNYLKHHFIKGRLEKYT